jgi:hypothetical protein
LAGWLVGWLAGWLVGWFGNREDWWAVIPREIRRQLKASLLQPYRGVAAAHSRGLPNQQTSKPANQQTSKPANKTHTASPGATI